MLEKIQEWYLEQLKSWIPAHRVAAAFTIFAILSSSKTNEYLSSLESFLRLNLTKINFETGGIFEKSTILDIAVSIILIFLAFITSSALSNKILKYLQNSALIQSKIIQAIEDAKSRLDIDEHTRKIAIEETSKIISKNKTLVSFPFGASELSFCLAFVLAATAPNIGTLDLVAILFFLVFGATLAYRSVFNYINKNLRYLILESVLTGKTLQFNQSRTGNSPEYSGSDSN